MKERIINKFGKKSIIIGVVILLGLVGLYSNNNESEQNLESKSDDTKVIENKISICDGVNIIEECELNGIQYSVYKYYEAVKEVSHMENKITYTREITGYCTLCADGTYSPTCATGRGACSHHGGVSQWNAPIYNNVAHYDQIKIIDSPAIAERYEKIEKY